MARKKNQPPQTEPGPGLRLVFKAESKPLLPPETEAELKRLIREINRMNEERRRQAEAAAEPDGPDWPPAA